MIHIIQSIILSNVFVEYFTKHSNAIYNEALTLIFSIIVVNFLVERYLDYLNNKRIDEELPGEVKDVYDAERYKKSQRYKKVNDKFSSITSSFSFMLVIFMLFFQVFGVVDNYAREFSDNAVFIALIFFGILMFASDIINTPFGIYDTFVIEEKFGFNKTTIRTFIFDKLKSWLLGGLIGGGALALIIWLYQVFGYYFWISAWIAITLFMVFVTMFYSTLIVPLFNKQTPLEDGELRNAIQRFCQKVGFKLTNVYVIDGSKRSTKANAYFSGLGSKKRIVLYDTLIEDLTTDEIVAVLAHEIGHYKHKHSLWSILIGILQSGFTLYLFSLFTVNDVLLSKAMGATEPGIHMVLMAFGVIYSPISTVIGLFMNYISRKNEYQADRFVLKHFDKEQLISSLKKLSSNNLSNLTPHPAFVFFHYSHPTLIQRIRALREAD
ncbi:MAG: M48 family metallopeptidase [Bacteroidales bacterium]|nr:M48 family metallopeptidase [Bacteroidales bacterium]